jgi:hypothetical protein
MLSNVISAHQRASENIQTHSEALPKHSNDTPKYVQMRPKTPIDFVFKFIHIKELKEKVRHRFH